jgi:hypothetical protein
MKYLFNLETYGQIENIEEAKKELVGLIEQTKPEAMYFSTIRRVITIVADVEDPHVELRLIFETLSKFGNVTIDPVSTFEEFGPFMEKL